VNRVVRRYAIVGEANSTSFLTLWL